MGEAWPSSRYLFVLFPYLMVLTILFAERPLVGIELRAEPAICRGVLLVTAGLSEAQCQLRVSLHLHLVGTPFCRTLVSFGTKNLSVFVLAGTAT